MATDPLAQFYKGTAPTDSATEADPLAQFYKAEADVAARPTPLRPLVPGVQVDPQRSETAFERFMSALTIAEPIQVGMIESLAQRRDPLKQVPAAVARRRRYGDLISEALPPSVGEGDRAAISALLGLGGATALDPLTWTGFGGLTKMGQARKTATLGRMSAELGAAGGDVARATARAKIAGELAPTFAEQARRGERALVSFAGKPLIKGAPVLGAAEQALEAGKAATPFLRVHPRLSGLEREAFLARSAEVASGRRRGERAAIRQLETGARELKALANKHKVSPEALKGALTETIERSRVDLPLLGPEDLYRAQIKALDDGLTAQLSVFGPEFSAAARGPAREAVVKINAINAVNLARKQAEGIPISGLIADEQYLKHMTTIEGQRLIDKNYPGGFSAFARQFTERHGAQQQRGLQGTLVEINERWQTGQLALSGFKPTKTKLFVDDPFIATVRASGETERAIEAARMLKDYARVAGRPKGQAPRGWMEVSSDLPELKGVLFPPPMAITLTKHFAPQSKAEFARAWKVMNRAWARSVTGLFPGFHTRNEVSDVWNSAVLGGANPRHFPEAITTLLGRDMQRPITLGPYRMTRARAMDLAERLNVVNSGQVGSLRSGADALSSPKGLAERLDQNAAMRFAQSVGEGRENSTRMMMFMDGLSKGMEPAVAAERVKTFLFDYGRLPEPMKAARDNALPFLAWTYYNAPLQASLALRKPGAFAGLQRVREAAAGDQPLGLEEQRLPPFLRERLPIRAGRDKEGHPQFMALEGFLPSSDVGVFTPGGAAHRLEGLLSPLITAPIEIATNYDRFRNEPLAPGRAIDPASSPLWGLTETTPFLGLNVPSRMMPLVEMVRLLTEANRLAGTGRGPVPSFPTRAGQFLTGGRVYPIDEEASFEQSVKGRQIRIMELRRLLRRYERRGDTRNAENVHRMIERLEAQGEGE